MKTALILALGLGLAAPALAPAPALSGGCGGGACCLETATCAPEITGKRARKNIRHFLYAKNLQGDKLRVYQAHGFTSDRLRVYHREGVVTETWSYPALGREFVFDGESRLLSERAIPADRVALE